MDSEQAHEIAIWLTKVAERYNWPILLITDKLKRAIDEHKDINLAKLNVVYELSKC